MTLTNNAHNSLLDLDPWVGQRSGTFRWELTDGASGQRLGDIYPDRDSPPTLTHDTTRTIKRNITPLVLTAADTAAINPVTDRVTLSMLVGGVSYPLGRYAFTDHTQLITTGGDPSTSTLVDEMFIVDQQLEVGFSAQNVTSGGILYYAETVDSSLRRLLTDVPVTLSVESTPFYSVNSWTQGTHRGQVVDELAVTGDYFPVWFDNDGLMRAIRSFDPATAVPDFDWDANDVVDRNSITFTSDVTTAPNRIIVVSNNIGSTDSPWLPIYGSYDVPSSAPHSFLNRGFRVPDVQSLAVATADQAIAMAQNIGLRGTVVERTDVTTPPDPRFDSHNVVRWRGVNWLELGWSLACVEGGNMRHTLRRSYL